MKRILTLIVAGLASVAFAQTAVANDPLIGGRVADFSLDDFHGRPHALSDLADKPVVVLAFLGTECPLARLYAPKLVALADQYEQQGVALLGIDSNVHDTPTKLTAYANAYGIGFPLLLDKGNKIADRVGATRTPEVFVLDADRVVRYHGRIDDQYIVGAPRDAARHSDLADALDAVLAGKEVSTPSTEFTGCLIAKVRKREPHGDITYAGDVAAIVNRHCVECHRDGELAPFSLASYDEVVPWAATIREVVEQQRMPPWFANPQYGEFSNDCSMSAEDRATLFAWIDNGCPQGNLEDLPPAPKFFTGWRMGEPDVVYEMDEEFEVPAEGTVDYQYFPVGPKLEKDLWVSIAEARPGNPRVVHHVVLFAMPPSADDQPPENAQRSGQMIGVYAPGMNPWRYPEGTAMKIAAGSRLVIQMHYTPNGAVERDRSYVGLKLLDPAEVKEEVRYGMVFDASFEIPPHASDHTVVARKRFLRDVYVLNLFPHMHYRGKAFRFEAEYPDGRREVLLDVPRYDFNWQLRYDLAKPVLLPRGSRLICTARYDNSEANPLNPDPSAAVRFGLQSWEEMLVGYYTTIRAPAGDKTARRE